MSSPERASVLDTPPWWPAVRDLRPVLSARVSVHRHVYRGERCYVLRDAGSGRHLRIGASAWEVIGRLDGRRGLDEAWRQVALRLGAEAPVAGEALAVVARLHAAGLVRCELPPQALEIFQHFAPKARGLQLPSWLAPLSMRFPLADPDRWLAGAAPHARWVFGPVGLASWLAVVGWAALLAGSHWDALGAGGLARVLDPNRLVLLVVLYPLVKACHELGHALAVRVWGGEVHEVGVALLVFMPIPYVDASAAAAFPERRRRMAVGAAGVMVELFLASLALFVWVSVEPGLVRTASWVVMVIGGASTLLFNGNPLLRYDGYYVLSDWLEIPNLDSRARRWWSGLFQRRVLGLPERREVPASPGEQRWLAGFGAASFAYRLLVMLWIALFVAERFVLVGALFLLAGMVLRLVLPAVQGLLRLRADPRVRERPRRTLGGALAAGVALVFLLAVLPLPSRTHGEGIVWLPDHAELRAQSDGFVTSVDEAPGTRVEAGTPLVTTVDPVQQTRVRVLDAALRALRAQHHAERGRDRVKAAQLEDEIAGARAELAEARARAAEGVIRAGAAGRLVLPDADALPGRFLQRGDLLGYVADLHAPVVRTVLPQSQIVRVRGATRRVEVRLASGDVVPGVVAREVPALGTELPSLALGSAGGGALAVDARDDEGLTAAEPVFQLDEALPEDTPVSGLGGRVRVRFVHPPEPLLPRVLRGLRGLFLGKLEA